MLYVRVLVYIAYGMLHSNCWAYTYRTPTKTPNDSRNRFAAGENIASFLSGQHQAIIIIIIQSFRCSAIRVPCVISLWTAEIEFQRGCSEFVRLRLIFAATQNARRMRHSSYFVCGCVHVTPAQGNGDLNGTQVSSSYAEWMHNFHKEREEKLSMTLASRFLLSKCTPNLENFYLFTQSSLFHPPLMLLLML